MRPMQARVNPDGWVAQRFDESFNGQGNWCLTHWFSGALTVSIFSDEDVADWPILVPAPMTFRSSG